MSGQTYDTGYGKPPKSGQFKKGQSGNPSGKKRPPKVEDVLKKALSQTVSVNVGGKKQKLPMLEVIIEALVRKAASGDLQAIKTVVAAAAMIPEDVIVEAAISDHQLAMLKDILATQLAGAT